MAVSQLSEFRNVAARSLLEPITMEVLDSASDLWAQARTRGLPADNADLVIAATALRGGGILVTGNRDHFSWIPGIILPDWRTAP